MNDITTTIIDVRNLAEDFYSYLLEFQCDLGYSDNFCIECQNRIYEILRELRKIEVEE